MYKDLPLAIQEQVQHFLLRDQFAAAKEIYDEWFLSQSHTFSPAEKESSASAEESI